MNALILAAGRGRRLWPYTAERPKCLLSLGPQTILEHQLERLAAAGVRQITVVAGFRIDEVRQQLQAVSPASLRVRVVYNPFYAVSDNLISLWAARAEMSDDVLLLNGDNVFHPDILARLTSDDLGPCTLLVHRRSCYGEDDMKVALDGDRLQHIGKDLSAAQTAAGSIGIMRFTGPGVDLLRDVLEEAVQGDGALRNYYLDVVQRMADAGCAVRCHDIGELPWRDVDTPGDLLDVRAGYERFVAVDALAGSGLRGRA